MLFGYYLRAYVKTQNSDVNMAAMDAVFVAVYCGMSVDRSRKTRVPKSSIMQNSILKVVFKIK